MYFGTKSYLKSTRNHTIKHALNAYYSDHKLVDKLRLPSPMAGERVRRRGGRRLEV